MHYRSRPTEVDAIQWTGENLRAVQDFLAPESPLLQNATLGINIRNQVGTLQLHWVSQGSYIVRQRNELRVVDALTFVQLYEPVEAIIDEPLDPR